MINIPDNIKELKTYKVGKSNDELMAEFGLSKVLNLGSNENQLGASPKGLKSMSESFSGIEFYPDGSCIGVRQKIASKFGLGVENISVGNGSEGMINYIYKAFFRGDDEMLTFNGSFIGVYIAAKSADMNCRLLDLKADYSFDLDLLLEEINENTRAVYLANPNNPTGTIFSKEEFKSFMEKVPENIIVVLDEAYIEFALHLDDDFLVGHKEQYENLIILRSFSKAFGLAGIRIAYGIASKEITEALLKVKLTFEPSAVAQAAGYGAIDDDEFIEAVVRNNKIGLEYYYKELKKLNIKFTKSYGNFVMVEFETENEVNKINQFLLSKGVVVRPLKAFGLEKCIRISIGRPEQNEYVVKQLNKYFN